MSRVFKWLGVALGGLLALAFVAYLAMHLISERRFGRTYDVAPLAVTRSTDSLAATRGERLARLSGCFGCHGPDLRGSVFYDEPGVARIVAPNLTQVVAGASDGQLARAIVRGVRVDGSGVFSMPSPMFYHLSDAALGDLLAFLRTLTPAPDTLPPTKLRPLGRLGLVAGLYQSLTGTIDTTVPRPAMTPDGPPEVLGRYLALTSCSECHGQDLNGDSASAVPNLAIVQSYAAGDFAKLLRTGVPLGGRKLDLMEDVALGRFAHFTDDEVAALYAYLHAER